MIEEAPLCNPFHRYNGGVWLLVWDAKIYFKNNGKRMEISKKGVVNTGRLDAYAKKPVKAY